MWRWAGNIKICIPKGDNYGYQKITNGLDTMMTTRKGTLRLSLTRIISFLVSCLILSLAWRVVEDDLPKTREEFENRAVLYHIMMDLEDFLLCKQKFIKYLDRRKRDHN